MNHKSRFALWQLIAIFVFHLLGYSAHAQTPAVEQTTPFTTQPGKDGPIQNYQLADINLSQSETPPITGWFSQKFAGIPISINRAGMGKADPAIVWYRIRFRRADSGNGPLAFSADYAAERIVLTLNGVEIFRTFTRKDEIQSGWNRPHMAILPQALITDATNELVVRVDAPRGRAIELGSLRVGSLDSIRADFVWRMWAKIYGPLMINGILLILTAGTLLFWLMRRRETNFGWLSLVGVIWMIRNLHYYLESPPIHLDLFWTITLLSLFALMVAIYGFVASFIGIANRKAFMIWLCLAGLVIAILNTIGPPTFRGIDLSLLAAVPISMLVLWVFVKHCIAYPHLDNLLMVTALTIAFIFSVHDLGIYSHKWLGAQFYLQPYGSLIVYSAFGFALGRKMLLALAAVENMNEVLEKRVAEAAEQLQTSETARRKLEVAAAVEEERQRLMREIHDGIGSNLVSALAVVQKQPKSEIVADTLKRSINDLRVAIDSLEPIDGDLPVILGNFRHRIEPDLKLSGIGLKWHVEAVPSLPWLEATNALHILRILQEITTNIIKHAKASLIEVNCIAQTRDDRAGVLVEFMDNGIGFNAADAITGKGLTNILSRSKSLQGQFQLSDNPKTSGTCVSLWLPISRPHHDDP